MTISLRDQREDLSIAAENAYTDSFPGGTAWVRMREAEKALSEFDAAHPDVLAEIQAEQVAGRDARLAARGEC